MYIAQKKQAPVVYQQVLVFFVGERAEA
jgi:hypothetical protein